ncbi:hypothetical protein SAMN04489765_4022 [Tsukamurella pulmonis]|uniref:Secreted protein n=2 Tax=Tsukamurella pulmonis TaxID=47312 RepID=A0A1H1HD72_9ACTN|nr:hypothetical protein [Tsukamurella pulmonis]SDR22986.1 hypothetical protein SAMN04489765_4022 [Tsukamurella pulmonis]SUP15249.1 Uncharacterised protein [Tsukamurella pulmonis]
MRKHSIATIASIAALVLLSAGCSDDSTPASTTSSTAPSSSSAAPHHPTAAAGKPDKPAAGTGGGGHQGPTKTVTQKPGPTRTVTAKPGAPTTQAPDSGQLETDCTGPDRGSICNPNHGAGDDPDENGTAPTTDPQVRDDDPGGSPCTTGMGVSGVYVPDDQGGWVCQIS